MEHLPPRRQLLRVEGAAAAVHHQAVHRRRDLDAAAVGVHRRPIHPNPGLLLRKVATRPAALPTLYLGVPLRTGVGVRRRPFHPRVLPAHQGGP